ncbi:hypothetical protein IJ21_27360 [Paenibacillus sp. 32O-W]|nr:hypothetical protein IJ21_27360 [Paenibacillus sp. 32O-W]
MPIARSTVLWGHVLTSVVSNVISVVVIILVALISSLRGVEPLRQAFIHSAPRLVDFEMSLPQD